MTRPSKPPGSGRSSHQHHHGYVRGDPIPVPDATETNTETSWALFSELSASEDMRYADTVPLTSAGAGVPHLPRPGGARRKLIAGALPQAATADAVLQLARQNHRVCPQPAKWDELYQLLLARHRSPATPAPMAPLTGEAWHRTPELAKRMCLRSQVEWAATHGCLDDVLAFVQALREPDWHHGGQ